MNDSKDLNQSGGVKSVDRRRNTSAVARPAGRAPYRCPVVLLLPVLILVAAPFLCADGITFNKFDGTNFVNAPPNVFTVSSSNLNFTVSSGGYFTSFGGSQPSAAGFNQTSGPMGPTGGFTPPGPPSFNVTTPPTGGPTGGPSINVTTFSTTNPSIDLTSVPEPASIWLVGIGLAIFGLWSNRKWIAERHV